MKKIFIALVAIAISVYLLFSYFFVDIQINKYSDIQTVRDHTAIQRGWIPAILPDSAYDIIETHNLDTNTILGSFQYKEKDEEKFMQNLTDINDRNHTLEWDNFLFKVDKKLNRVKFRNKQTLGQH